MSGISAARGFLARRLLRTPEPLVFDDRVGSWSAAREQSTGYDEQMIVEQVTQATQTVLAGRAAFERDGVTFTQPEYRWPIAYALQRAAGAPSVQARGQMRVIDIGGSLGSLYWQHRNLLPDVDISWTVIEQPAFVTAGRALRTKEVEFAESIDDLGPETGGDVALFSSVLQYLDDPWTVLRAVMASGVNQLVIDRTPFHDGTRDIATVQHVPAHIYAASYPAWILSRSRLESELADWRILAEFPGIEPAMRTRSGVAFTWSGCIAERAER